MHSLAADEIRQALSHVDAHDRDTWVRMAMAIKSELGGSGFEIWNEWSATASNYQARAARSVWRSVRAFGGVTIGSLIAEAEVLGWVAPWSRAQPETPEQAGRRRQEAERRRRAMERQARHDQAQIQAEHKAAVRRAQALLSEALPSEHPYLKDKGLGATKGLVLPDGALLVPMRHWRDNSLMGAQIIRLADNEWQKKMLPGMRAKGAVLCLGTRQAAELVLCEGYATGISIELAARQLCLSMTVVVCFSDGNLVHVASLLSGRRYVFADHDASGAGECAAKKTGLPYCMSDKPGEDANDLMQRAGLIAVCRLLMGIRRPQA